MNRVQTLGGRSPSILSLLHGDSSIIDKAVNINNNNNNNGPVKLDNRLSQNVQNIRQRLKDFRKCYEKLESLTTVVKSVNDMKILR